MEVLELSNQFIINGAGAVVDPLPAIFDKYCREKKVTISTAKSLAKFAVADNKVAVGSKVVVADFGLPRGFPESEHFIVLAMKLSQAVDANLNESDWDGGITNKLLKNYKLSISNNGTIVIKDLPLTSFPNSTAENLSGVYMLDRPILWVAQTALTATLNTEFTIAATANLNVRIELIGFKLI